MKLGIMQPYFFPYIGHFQLIHATDHYIFFDTPQYERRGWMNRNRIINLREGSTYISVPVVKAPQQTSLLDIKINNKEPWKDKIISQLEVYKKIAPYYSQTTEFVASVLEMAKDSLAELNILSITETCKYLSLDIHWDVFSKMDLNISKTCLPDEWALEITKALHYEEYINAPGGQAFFNPDKYASAGIKLSFIQPDPVEYVQKIGRFEPNLSIVDVLMYNSIDEVRDMLTQYHLI